MKRMARLLTAAWTCLILFSLWMFCFPACGASESIGSWAGPWHPDETLNDLTAFPDLFAGYEEFGAGMEIRSSGQMSWFIGENGGYGTYTGEEDVLHAALMNNAGEEMSMDLLFLSDGDAPLLEMQLEELTIFWRYGDREDIPLDPSSGE